MDNKKVPSVKKSNNRIGRNGNVGDGRGGNGTAEKSGRGKEDTAARSAKSAVRENRWVKAESATGRNEKNGRFDKGRRDDHQADRLVTGGYKRTGQFEKGAGESRKPVSEYKVNGQPQKRRGDNGQSVGERKGSSRYENDHKDTRIVKSPCPVSRKCGGCRWIHKSYEEQLKQKEKWVKELLQPYCSPEPIVGMEEPSHYRNKVHAVFGEDKKHNPVSGIYEEGTHNIVPVDSCLIENRKADEIIVSIRSLLKSFKIRPYNEDTGYGLLRHVLIRTGHVTGEIMVVLVLSSPVMPSKNNFVKALLKLHPEITTVVVNVNNRSTTMVLGDKEQVIYGKGYIEDVLCGMTFRISPKSFYQVNPVQAEKLYQKALEYAGLTGTETVVDAYCGTGTIGMIASAQAGKVIGVELNADAVKDARNNAKRNEVKNIQFYQNDAGKFLVEMAEQQASVDVLLMDPPRSGSDEDFLRAVAKIMPEKIVYISCNPETLVRDLKVLKKSGYGVMRGGAVDMFPFTDHIEVVIMMTYCGSDKKNKK